MLPIAVLGLEHGCAPEEPAFSPSDFFSADELRRIHRASPLPEIPPNSTNHVAVNSAAAQLGQFVFFDTRFSKDGTIACATCHDPLLGFGDAKKLSEGINTTARHSPSVINSAYNPWQFWDGRADSLWAQALGPLESADEHGGSRLQYAHLIAEDSELKIAYESVFASLPDLSNQLRFPAQGRPVVEDAENPHAVAWATMSAEDQELITTVFVNLGKSIAAYERLLTSGETPFDRFVDAIEKNESAGYDSLSGSAKSGLKIFMGRGGCHLCHLGSTFTNNGFHNIGLGSRGWLDASDNGRYDGVDTVLSNPFNADGPYADEPDAVSSQRLASLQNSNAKEGQFKVPGLRNVADTAPYMHGGHFQSLEEVVAFYSELNEQSAIGERDGALSPLHLSESEIADVVEFLKSLSGNGPPAQLLLAPQSP